jgi:hypothetical protein
MVSGLNTCLKDLSLSGGKSTSMQVDSANPLFVSQKLLAVSSICEGQSGRYLRKLPFQAYASCLSTASYATTAAASVNSTPDLLSLSTTPNSDNVACASSSASNLDGQAGNVSVSGNALSVDILTYIEALGLAVQKENECRRELFANKSDSFPLFNSEKDSGKNSGSQLRNREQKHDSACARQLNQGEIRSSECDLKINANDVYDPHQIRQSTAQYSEVGEKQRNVISQDQNTQHKLVGKQDHRVGDYDFAHQSSISLGNAKQINISHHRSFAQKRISQSSCSSRPINTQDAVGTINVRANTTTNSKAFFGEMDFSGSDNED